MKSHGQKYTEFTIEIWDIGKKIWTFEVSDKKIMKLNNLFLYLLRYICSPKDGVVNGMKNIDSKVKYGKWLISRPYSEKLNFQDMHCSSILYLNIYIFCKLYDPIKSPRNCMI